MKKSFCTKMVIEEQRRYKISEVSTLTDVPPYVLRQWEDRFPQLRPKRDKNGKRYYSYEDIQLVLQIRRWLWQDGLTSEGVKRLLRQGRRTADKIQVRREIINTIEDIEKELREIIHSLDKLKIEE